MNRKYLLAALVLLAFIGGIWLILPERYLGTGIPTLVAFVLVLLLTLRRKLARGLDEQISPPAAFQRSKPLAVALKGILLFLGSIFLLLLSLIVIKGTSINVMFVLIPFVAMLFAGILLTLYGLYVWFTRAMS